MSAGASPWAVISQQPAAGGAAPGPWDVVSHAAAPSSTPNPPAPNPIQDAMTANNKGEGTYSMTDPSGAATAIPYSSVDRAHGMGYRFADEGTRSQYARDLQADPIHESMIDRYLENQPWWSKALNAPAEVNAGILEGIGSGLEGTAAGIDRLGRKVTGGRLSRPEEGLQDEAARPNTLPGSTAGEATEAAGEWFSGEELLKMAGEGLGVADRLKQTQQLANLLNGSPKLAKLLKIGASAVKNFALAGGQTFLRSGGDAGQALTAGAVGAGAGAAVEGVGGAIGSAVRKRATTLENIGGEEIPIPAEVRNNKPTPQQAGGQRAITTAARSTATAHLGELDEALTPPGGPKALPAKTGPFTFELRQPTPTEGSEGQIAHTAGKQQQPAAFPPKYTTASGPEPVNGGTGTTGADVSTAGPAAAKSDTAAGGGVLRTQDPNIAREHIAQLNKLVDSSDFAQLPKGQQSDILAARREAQQQMGDYHERVIQNFPGTEARHFEPIDIPATVRRIGSYSDAANELESHAVKGYDVLNDASGGKFNAIREENKEAWRAYAGAPSEEAQQAAEQRMDTANRHMDDLMKSLRGVVNDRELDGFNDAFRNAQALRRVGSAVDSSFSGNASESARSWEYRGFDGQKLMTNLDRITRTMGRPQLERVVGADNLDTLYRVAEANRTQASRAKFGAAIKPVVRFLLSAHALSGAGIGSAAGWKATHTWEGAAVGATAGALTQKASSAVMDSILTNPRIAQNVLFAIDSGAKPENYGPVIGAMIQEAQKQEEPTQ